MSTYLGRISYAKQPLNALLLCINTDLFVGQYNVDFTETLKVQPTQSINTRREKQSELMVLSTSFLLFFLLLAFQLLDYLYCVALPCHGKYYNKRNDDRRANIVWNGMGATHVESRTCVVIQGPIIASFFFREESS